MPVITKNIIGFQQSHQGKDTIQATNPRTLQTLEEGFYVAGAQEIELAMQKAAQAFQQYKITDGRQRAAFLEAIAGEIEALGQELVDRAVAETGLPEGRIAGERGRTCGQLRLFANIAREGSWVEAVIDTALPDRKPLPRPDIRKMLRPLGPVVVFSASNFPLAFSTAGGDTASALAAGCPVIVKAHESHLGTNSMVAGAISEAARKTGMPDGVFSSLNGIGFTLGQTLVKHPLAKAVAFTGSHRGGKALYDLATQRPEPIPVFAEMGSVNPVILLEKALAGQAASLATQLAGSVTLGAGQFCTNPGLIFAPMGVHLDEFMEKMVEALAPVQAQTMLNQGIFANFSTRATTLLQQSGVKVVFNALALSQTDNIDAAPVIAYTDAAHFMENPQLHQEIFGPFSLVVGYQNEEELSRIVHSLEGQLTASVFTAPDELQRGADWFRLLEDKVGRLVINGVPTGVEVCYAMQHGGPYPATTDSRFTSVGAGAIKRFARPVAYQGFADALLPEALKNANPENIWRMVNGNFSKDLI